jgi:hypothetical protein
MHDPECEENHRGDAHPAGKARGTLLVDDSGAFCVGPREKVHAILDVQRYIAKWPLIPAAELHASSVQHPDDLGMRWLLHTRRVKCTPVSDVAQLAETDTLPKSAGIGDKEATVWCCRLLGVPRMPYHVAVARRALPAALHFWTLKQLRIFCVAVAVALASSRM